MTQKTLHTAVAITDDFDFEPYHREWMVRQEREWRAAGLAVSWIDTRPKWISIINWSWPEDALFKEWPLVDPKTPCRRAWRFSLIGGGQIKIVEHWVETREPWPSSPVWNPRIDIVVAAHVDDRLRTYRGVIDDILGEMQAGAVVLRGTSEEIQAVADRAAATLRALTSNEADKSDCTHPERDRFYALLDGARGCSICGRSLRDEVSKLLAIGPDCARQWQIPHSRGAASKRLELRAQILGTTKMEARP